jgi:hypothetical protein
MTKNPYMQSCPCGSLSASLRIQYEPGGPNPDGSSHAPNLWIYAEACDRCCPIGSYIGVYFHEPLPDEITLTGLTPQNCLGEVAIAGYVQPQIPSITFSVDIASCSDTTTLSGHWEPPSS